MIKHCIICDVRFETYDKLRKGRNRKLKRGVNTITCKKRCSQIYYSMTVKERCEIKDIHYTRHNKAKKEVTKET